MATPIKAIVGGILAVIAVVALKGVAGAATATYTCPYGDGLTFTSLAKLQEHVQTEHPGEKVPVSLKWS